MTKENLFAKVVYARKLEVVSRKVAIAEGEGEYLNRTISFPDDVYRLFKRVFENQAGEIFVAIHLKSNNGITAFEIITKGILNSSLVHPREVFRSAIIQNAAGIICCHNHPSGNPQPSEEDLAITKQLVEAGKIIGIPVHDHVIFTESNFYSFAEHGSI